MKRNYINFKYYYQMSLKKNALFIWAIIIAPFILFSQKQTSIQPIPAQKSLSSSNNNMQEVNGEYDKVLKEYETLLKKYPAKKYPAQGSRKVAQGLHARCRRIVVQ